MDSFSRLFQEAPDFGEIVFYMIALAVMFVALILGRLVLRSMVNSRVKSIHTEGLDLGDLSSMGQKGLLTDEELKKFGGDLRERQLEETQAEASGIKARDLLLAIEADPSRATSLLPPSSEHAEKALEGLKKPGEKNVEDQLRAQLGAGPVSINDAGDPLAGLESPSSATGKASRPAPQHDKSASKSSSPLPQAQQEAPTPAGKSTSGDPSPKSGMDLDAMLSKGLISQREYDLLIARVKKAGG